LPAEDAHGYYLLGQGILLLLITSALLTIGPLLALSVRPRDLWADVSVGGLTALIGAIPFFFFASGPASTADLTERTIRADVRLLANGYATREDPVPPEGGAHSPTPHPQDVLQQAYPDLRAAPEGRRAEYLAGKILADLWSAALKGIWLGLLASLVVFLPTGVFQTVAAGHLLRHRQRLWRIVVPSLEVGVLALAWSCCLLGMVLIGFGIDRLQLREFIPWLALLSLWLGLALLGVLHGWPWWRRWLLHLTFAAAAVGVTWAINSLVLSR
jgi:hypothetical protein